MKVKYTSMIAKFHDDWNHDLNQKADFSCVTKMKLETWGTGNYAT